MSPGREVDSTISTEVDSSSTGASTYSGDVPLEQPTRLNSSWHFVVVTSAFTLGSVFSPFTLGAGGWVWGSIFWIYSYGSTWWSGMLIGKCVLRGTASGASCTYPDMMAEAFGRWGYWFTAVMQIATYFLLNVTLLVNFADWCLQVQRVLVVRGVVESGSMCMWEYLILGGCISCLLAQIPTFTRVMPLAVLSLLSTLIRQGIMYYQILQMDLLSLCEPTYDGVTPKSAFLSLATTALMFGGHGLFPEEMRELRRPKSFFGALHKAYVIIGVVYFSNAYMAYAVWGKWVSADIQLNFPLNLPTLVSALLSAFWGLVEATTSHVMMLSLIEHHIGLAKQTRARLWRVVLRSSFVALETFLAVMFSSAGLGNLQGVVAAVGFTALTYYAPFLAYWKLVLRPRGAPCWQQAVHILMAATGLVLMFVGIYASTDGMVAEIAQYHLFDTSRCSIADVVNIASCSNPCLAAYGFNTTQCETS
mmetsp:Transcript_38123/g.109624  ORF Transcript_38123/g.109624 Transcript_38123/m.109624 type:complete len:476 (-) Transcript_38123:109-1536(-)|eukprot:CAMPEP_0176067802 /NCGR_PEP_ID=MMETSP0120_2-20121206/33845_1 /TAXON_ID=160619 /ORGANISM="Kryptoperidinium foliaceum, Strain CCMP 1326" /LENGTH=475 /DNA_ID=CAMNT_0017401423 /DNA_START=84 /DNA_END=1511 /DNA_ORIENTATION=-